MIGQDNNRATFAYVDVVEELPNDDPFNDVDDSQRVVHKERVTNGDKKGLEITGYVANSLTRELLTEEEFQKTAILTSNNPFESLGAAGNNSFEDPFSFVGNYDPFGDPFAH
ncbi:hypothetical protein D3C75_710460 [compost metagenome]